MPMAAAPSGPRRAGRFDTTTRLKWEVWIKAGQVPTSRATTAEKPCASNAKVTMP